MTTTQSSGARVLLFTLRPPPRSLRALPRDTIDNLDALRAVLDNLPTGTRRLIVVGTDAHLGAVLTRLLRTERLDIELGFVPATGSRTRRIYRLGLRVGQRARDGKAQRVPLIRDDSGSVLVGRASWTDQDGGGVTGEATVDDTRLFDGTAAIDIEPTLHVPGLRAAVRGWPRRWVAGRAVQLGTTEAVVVIDGIPGTRSVTRSTFYRHQQGWLLVR